MPSTSIPGTIAASRTCGSGTTTWRMPRSAAAITIGSTPGTERSPPARVSSPMNTTPVERAARHDAGGAEHGDRDGQVVVGAALGQVGRREQDRGTAGGRPLELAVDDRHPAPVAGLVERGVGPADEHGGHLARRDVGLDVDEVADGAVERHRVAWSRTAFRPAPRRGRRSTAPRRGRSTATRSTRTSSGRTSCSSAHRHTSRCSRSSRTGSTASCGDPHPSPRRVLTSQATSTSPSRSTRSSSPSGHRQLRSSSTIPRSVGEQPGGEGLAVGTQRLSAGRGRRHVVTSCEEDHRCSRRGRSARAVPCGRARRATAGCGRLVAT